MDDDVVVCRCEEVTAGAIRTAIGEGSTTVDEIKRLTRIGMGLCRGTTCLEQVARIIAEETGQPIAEIELPRSRPPVRPIAMELLADHSI